MLLVDRHANQSVLSLLLVQVTTPHTLSVNNSGTRFETDSAEAEAKLRTLIHKKSSTWVIQQDIWGLRLQTCTTNSFCAKPVEQR